jgi:hypothetical protein
MRAGFLRFRRENVENAAAYGVFTHHFDGLSALIADAPGHSPGATEASRKPHMVRPVRYTDAAGLGNGEGRTREKAAAMIRNLPASLAIGAFAKGI